MEKLIGILCLSFWAWSVNASTFLPENSMWIGTEEKSLSMSELEFNATIDKVEKVYKPIVEATGKKYIIERNWDDGTVNAYAYQEGDELHIAMFGGLARYPTISNDGFLLVVCHETGHHLGGAPKYGDGNDWASNEGQSDYWGVLKCAKRVFDTEDNIAAIKGQKIPAIVKEKCEASWKSKKEVALCERLALAGYGLAQLLGGGEFETPDQTVVTRTQDSHPEGQIRLDTFLAASVCTVPFSVDTSPYNADFGVCVTGDGARPKSWYKQE